MKKRCLSALFLTFFIVLFIVSDVGVVCALTINADGSVDLPDCVEQFGDVYVITANLTSLLDVNKDHIVIDGNGYTLNIGGEYAVELMNVNNVTLKNLIITGSSLQIGILLRDSFNCTIMGNKISDTKHISPRAWATAAINVYGGGSHIISDNLITLNDKGILLGPCVSPSNITGNNIKNNSEGIDIYETSGNFIYNSNFINNYVHVVDRGIAAPESFSASVNIWDDGVTGNYWDDYNGTDSDGDGIGNTPYVLFEDNQDNYPLMNPVEVDVIPEFPSWIILPLFLVGCLVVAGLRKKIEQ